MELRINALRIAYRVSETIEVQGGCIELVTDEHFIRNDGGNV